MAGSSGGACGKIITDGNYAPGAPAPPAEDVDIKQEPKDCKYDPPSGLDSVVIKEEVDLGLPLELEGAATPAEDFKIKLETQDCEYDSSSGFRKFRRRCRTFRRSSCQKKRPFVQKEDEVLDIALQILQTNDEDQIFGDFVASSLRSLQSSPLKKQLKLKIQRAVLEVEEMDSTPNTSTSTTRWNFI